MLSDRFWSKVDRNGPVPSHRPDLGPCWVWIAGLERGYGRFRLDGRQGRLMLAHRLAYELLIGPIPEGLTLDHLCRKTACVNPRHLEPVTQRANVLRGVSIVAESARKTCCPQGHPYDEKNTRIYRGWRYCRTCKRDHENKRRRLARNAA